MKVKDGPRAPDAVMLEEGGIEPFGRGVPHKVGASSVNDGRNDGREDDGWKVMRCPLQITYRFGVRMLAL